MKKIILLLLLSIYSISNFSQEINKKDSLKSPIGVYTSFTQFNSKSPKYKRDFAFNNRTAKQIWGWGGTEYEIKIADKYITKKFINDSIWAVNDDKDFYINNKLVSVNKGFDKLEKLDFPISYFISYIIMRDEDAERAALASMFGAIGGGYAATPYKRVIAIDMRTGALLRMNEFGFTKLLKDDNELMEDYKKVRNEKANERLIMDILDKYNLKQKNNR